ncbi:hypothetical protein EV177_008836 [Coemansia sp. RSA 1804]|nr:hypothetical protein EV177_008836 [Coemansia sp. RSA 1804]
MALVSEELTKDASKQMKVAKRSVYWCDLEGQRAMLKFKESWVLDIAGGGTEEGELYRESKDDCEILVYGLCPFHVVAKRLPDQTTYCGGNNIHMHQAPEDSGSGMFYLDPDKTTKKALDMALVTRPMPMDALIRLPELRALSLYAFEDPQYKKSYPDAYADIDSAAPSLFSLDPPRHANFFVNPVCHRILQQQIHEKRWKHDESSEYSLDSWGNEIDFNNIPFFRTGMHVPFPQTAQFHAPMDSYKVSVCFWNVFQQDKWRYFLNHDTGPCYLDAAYRCDKDGLQVWTLFFEYHGITVPVSYLVSTAITQNLVAAWLEAITEHHQPLPSKKTIYVNSTKLLGRLGMVFPGWNVCYSKYYFAEEFRSLVLRPGRHSGAKWSTQTVDAVKSMGINPYGVIQAAKQDKALMNKVGYLVHSSQKWLPQSAGDLNRFNHSETAVSRWRYLLWMTMLCRPNNGRVDSVIYYLHRILTAGVEATTSAYDRGKHKIQYTSMGSMEQGNPLLSKELAHTRILPIADQLVCVHSERELSSKAIVDLKHKVCFCLQFVEHGMCEHLVFCSSDDIHQPELIQLMECIPEA